MLVSVLIPAFNRERYIRAAVASIQRQTYEHLEILVQDDGSTDSTSQIVSELAARDPRVRLERFEENRGIPTARNRLIERAAGDFIAFHDSDDLAAPEKIALQVRFMQSHPSAIAVGTGCALIDHTGCWTLGRMDCPARYYGLPQLPNLACPSILYRAAILRQAMPLRTSFRTNSDIDLVLRVSELGPINNLRPVLYFYRQHDGQISRTQQSGHVIAIASRLYCALGHDDIVAAGAGERELLQRIVADWRLLVASEFKAAACYVVVHAARRVGRRHDMLLIFLFHALRRPGVLFKWTVEWFRFRVLGVHKDHGRKLSAPSGLQDQGI